MAESVRESSAVEAESAVEGAVAEGAAVEDDAAEGDVPEGAVAESDVAESAVAESNVAEGDVAVGREDDLAQLRGLLFPSELAEIDSFRKRLNDPKRRAEDLSQSLPEAIVLRSSRDKRLTNALMPSIEEGIAASVRKDPATLANAIFPVIGPAIRKTISQIFNQMVQSLNQTLEHSLSIQGVKWRLEALRVGKPFAEVVLSHTLLFSVEQVFLIHKKTGLLLQHVARPTVATQDADLVSGMLTAIQDFVRDSLGAGKGDELESMQVGELTVWIEQGQQAVIAAVIRGNAPNDLRATMQDALDTIHLRQRAALDSFEGNAAPFLASRGELESCLQMQLESKRKKTSPLLWAALALATIALGIWMFFSIRANMRWNNYLNELKAEPGLVVVSDEKRGGKHFITGLRDPMAVDPAAKLEATNINPESVISRWEPYQSAYPEFVLTRAKGLLQPPGSVSLKVEDGSLVAEGVAPRAWIAEARRLAQAISGVASFRDENLVDADVVESRIEDIKRRMEANAITFETGSAELLPDQNDAVAQVASAIQSLDKLAQAIGKKIRVEVFGYTDQSGTERTNQRLRQQRAETVRAALISRGADAGALVSSAAEAQSAVERKAIFKATVIDGAKAGQ
jgi:outer membrane protein OmpA-like peptidoglycan-associated protein